MILLFIVTGVVPVVLALAIYGYYMVDRTSPDEDVLSCTDTYTVRDQPKEVRKMSRELMIVGKVVLGKRVGMDTPMVRSNRMSDHLKVEPVAPIIPLPEKYLEDSDPWLFMRMTQQWKLAGRKQY
jgi:hypothetical protein